MAAETKWIVPISPDAPVEEVAAEALRGRLKRVWTLQRAKSQHREGGARVVHQLRVAARRAEAALECFADFLPARRKLEMLQLVKKSRKAAGQARDLDVLMQRIREDARHNGESAWGKLFSALRKERRRAKEEMLRVRSEMTKADYPRLVQEIVERVRPRRKVDRLLRPTFVDVGRHALRSLLGDFFQVAQGDLSQIEVLHGCRILGKMLRYGMEIFAPGMSPVLRDKAYPILVQLQEKLGAVNDHAVALEYLAGWRKQIKSEALARLIQEREKVEQMALAERRLEVLAWWTPKVQQMMKDYCSAALEPPPAAHGDTSEHPSPLTSVLTVAHSGV